jgi:hypothetical protein
VHRCMPIAAKGDRRRYEGGVVLAHARDLDMLRFAEHRHVTPLAARFALILCGFAWATIVACLAKWLEGRDLQCGMKPQPGTYFLRLSKERLLAFARETVKYI